MSGPFSKISSGPANASGVDTDKVSLIFDQQNNIVESVGLGGTQQALETSILNLSAQTALANVTTAQNLFSQTLNVGALNKTNRTLRISVSAIFTTTNAGTVTIAIKLGSTTLVSIVSGTTAASITNGQIVFEIFVTVVSTGATGTLETHGEIGVQLSGTLSTALPYYVDQNVAVSSAVNLQSALALTATVACSASFSSVQLRQATVEVVN